MHAATDDPSTWATHDEAAWWAGSQHGDGCGLVLGIADDECVCGIDLDRCRDKTTGELAPWAQAVVDRFATYTEISPSETGVKLFFTTASADLPAVEALFDGKFGRAFKNGSGEHPPAIEVYRGRRYFAITWESCGETDDLRQVSLADLEWLIRDAGPKFDGQGSGKSNDDSRSAKAFRAGAALKASGASYEEMRDALLGHTDPEIAEWARSKGMANGERELRRIYDRAPTGAGVISLRAPYDTARLFQRGLTTPLLILSNELFRLADASGALASRFILLMLTKSFYGREDQSLTAKLLTELPGILHWAIVGWARLRRFGHFRQPASAAEAIEQLEDLASPIGAFVRERCETGAAYTVGVEELFGAWQTWCAAQGRDHPGTKQSFGRDLRSALPELKIAQPRAGGERVRAYQGLRLKPISGARAGTRDSVLWAYLISSFSIYICKFFILRVQLANHACQCVPGRPLPPAGRSRRRIAQFVGSLPGPQQNHFSGLAGEDRPKPPVPLRERACLPINKLIVDVVLSQDAGLAAAGFLAEHGGDEVERQAELSHFRGHGSAQVMARKGGDGHSPASDDDRRADDVCAWGCLGQTGEQSAIVCGLQPRLDDLQRQSCDGRNSARTILRSRRRQDPQHVASVIMFQLFGH
jgi:hypothetical protein